MPTDFRFRFEYHPEPFDMLRSAAEKHPAHMLEEKVADLITFENTFDAETSIMTVRLRPTERLIKLAE